MQIKKDRVANAVAVLLIASGLILLSTVGPSAVTLLSFVFSVVSWGYGRKKKKEVETLKSALDGLVEDKEDLKEELETTEERKKLKSQRLRNLKQVLDREGIDTDYLIDKYGDPLYAPLLVLTHFRADKGWNTEEGEQLIRKRLDELDAKVLHGATRVIPPRSLDQDIETREELEEWFYQEVLGGDDSLTYKLELMSTIDLRQVFGEDKAGDDGGQFDMNTIGELFDTDTLLPTADLIDILARSDRISMEEELRENIALLAIPYASEQQIEEIIQKQPSIQNELGDVTQIGNTDKDQIEKVLKNHGVSGAGRLADEIRQEAISLKPILNGEVASTDSGIKTEQPSGYSDL